MEQQKIIQKIFERLYKRLKPSLKNRALFLLIPEESPIKDSVAQTIYTNPPTIKIYIKTFERLINSFIHENIKEVITHEVIHVIGLDHYGTDENEHKVNFFKEDERKS